MFSLFKSQMFLNSLHRAIAEEHLLAESSPGRSKPQQTRLRGSADAAGCVSWLVASHFWGRLAPVYGQSVSLCSPPYTRTPPSSLGGLSPDEDVLPALNLQVLTCCVGLGSGGSRCALVEDAV